MSTKGKGVLTVIESEGAFALGGAIKFVILDDNRTNVGNFVTSFL